MQQRKHDDADGQVDKDPDYYKKSWHTRQHFELPLDTAPMEARTAEALPGDGASLPGL
jgi:hypothetical protein